MTDLSVFETIAQQSLWGDFESVSGGGSTIEATSTLRPQLAEAFRALGIRSLVDAPCGDMNWMRHLEYEFEMYIGVDIAPTVVEKARERGVAGLVRESGSQSATHQSLHNFQVGNLVTDVLPQADALFCRDCFVHLPLSAVHEAIRRIKLARFRFLFVTNFSSIKVNEDIPAGDWRPRNMQAPPFSWPKPLLTIREGHPPPHEDKSIGVWAL